MDPNASVLPGRFLGGSALCVQELELVTVPFPALPALLASASDLPEFRLYDIHKTGYILSEAIVAGVAALTSLWFFHIGFKAKIFHPG